MNGKAVTTQWTFVMSMPMQLKHPPTNFESGPWKEISRVNGIRTIQIPDFETFSKFVNIGFGDDDSSHIWRGQRCAAWEITSGLVRAAGTQEIGHLDRFHAAVARCHNMEFDFSSDNSKRKRSEFELWSLGQHYGLATPLTDWTVYPYVALFFAFVESDVTKNAGEIDLQPSCNGCNYRQSENGRTKCDFRAVYALNLERVKIVNFELVETRGMQPFKQKLDHPPYSCEFKQYLLDNRFVDPKWMAESQIPPSVRDWICKAEWERLEKKQLEFYRPSTHNNHRIHSQGGWHVFCPNNQSVEKWVRANYSVMKHTGIVLLTKIIMPNIERKVVLECLNKMNVNYLTLFQDLEGAAKHCNLALYEGKFGGGRGY